MSYQVSRAQVATEAVRRTGRAGARACARSRNALDSGRVHHAFLFTGTRGVGKTTIARIFAKSLNCETRPVVRRRAASAAPAADIDAGRFVDLLEIDAASNTGVDDVREVIENAQYAPARGRFKVYLIDEVHMLSKPAFNALLKTLEEPPPHVKFLLATTDPQKLPVTVLSRCLQFNLKRLLPEQISGQMTQILDGRRHPLRGRRHPPNSHARQTVQLRDGLSLLDRGHCLSAPAAACARLTCDAMLGCDPSADACSRAARCDSIRRRRRGAARGDRAPRRVLAGLRRCAGGNRGVLHRGAAPATRAGYISTEEGDDAGIRRLTGASLTAGGGAALLTRSRLPAGATCRSRARRREAGFEMTMLRMLCVPPVAAGESTKRRSRHTVARPLHRPSGSARVARELHQLTQATSRRDAGLASGPQPSACGLIQRPIACRASPAARRPIPMSHPSISTVGPH